MNFYRNVNKNNTEPKYCLWIKKLIINLFILIKNREQEIRNKNPFTRKKFEFCSWRFSSVIFS